MSIITNLIPGLSQIKLVLLGIIVAILLGFLGWVWYQHHQLGIADARIQTLITQNTLLQQNANTLKNNLDDCVKANGTENSTIEALIKERDAAEAAISALNNRQLENTSLITDLTNKLNDLKKNSANDGTLAPDLAQTISGIEAAEEKNK